MEEEGKDYTYLQDELGSAIRLLEMGSDNQMIYGYDEFGVDTYKTQGRYQPFGYTGYRYDSVADTYFAQAREYKAELGRFAGEDWIKGDIGIPYTLNQYGYCWSNPMVLVDRDGRFPETPLPDLPTVNILYDPDKPGNAIQQFVKYQTKVDITKKEVILMLEASTEAPVVRDSAMLADQWTDRVFSSGYKSPNPEEFERTGDPELAPHWQDGDAANAYRHAMWNALMTKNFKSGAVAEKWATAHEAWPDEILDMPHTGGFLRRDHTAMDLYNNAQGRSVVGNRYDISVEEISNKIFQKLIDGELIHIVKNGWYKDIIPCESSD